jgi:MFS family permease
MPWAFLVTLLPTYLKDGNVEIGQRGTIQTGILMAGCGGLLLGGLLADAVYKRLGARWGRSAPTATMMTICGLMTVIVSSSPGLWIAVAALAIASFCLDLALPSLWAYAQDVAGKNSGAAFGFGNMLGNLGASLSALVLGPVSRAAGWEGAFVVCASCYFAAAFFGLRLDASKRLDSAS